MLRCQLWKLIPKKRFKDIDVIYALSCSARFFRLANAVWVLLKLEREAPTFIGSF